MLCSLVDRTDVSEEVAISIFRVILQIRKEIKRKKETKGKRETKKQNETVKEFS
jgi:hypothetical protein